MSVLRTLVLGWGNPGRGDDGLGPAFAAALGVLALPGVTVESGYQLQVEDAAEVARYERVLFVDADRKATAPFRLERLKPAGEAPGFTSHGVAPGLVLRLSRELFGAAPEAWLLGIRGYDFDEFGEGLSTEAAANLAAAADFVRAAIGSGGLTERPESAWPAPG